MASLVQESGKQRSTGASPFALSYNFASLPAVGNVIAITVWGWGDTAVPNFNAFDNQNNVYKVIAGPVKLTSFNVHVCLITAVVLKSSGTFTVTVVNRGNGAAVSVVYNAQEWSGITDLPELINTSIATGATPTTNSIAIKRPNSLLLAGLVCDSGQASITNNTAGSNPTSWAEEIEELDSTTYQAGEADSVEVTAVGTYTHIWTIATSTPYAALIANMPNCRIPSHNYDRYSKFLMNSAYRRARGK